MGTTWLSGRGRCPLKGAVIAAGLLAGALSASGAWAHAYLVKAIPAQRAVVFAPPARVVLWFNERLEPRFCTMTVADAAGKSVDRGDPQVPGDNPKQLTVGLQPLTPGVYTVQFRVLSVDSHVVADQFTFKVAAGR